MQSDLTDLFKQALASNDPQLLIAAYHLATSLYHNFTPRPDKPEEFDQQTSFVTDQFKGIACILGGNRSGKTRAAGYKVAKFIRETPPPDKETRFWILSQTIEMASGVCWAQHLEEFLPEAEIVAWHNQARGYPAAVRFNHKNGNHWTLEFRSYDQGRKALQAASIAGFWCDEQIEHDLLDEIETRTSNYRFAGNKLYTLTPLMPDYELEKKFAEQENHPRWKFYRLNARLNPTVEHDFLDSALEQMRETRAIGAFASYAGSIYRTFGSHHVVEPFEVPQGWRRIAGIDFGWDHPTVCLFAAKDLTGRLWVYDEYVQSQNSIEDHVEAIKHRWPGGADYGDIWADYAAAQERHEFAIRGLPTLSAHKDVISGIAKVQQLLRNGMDGKPRLLISKNCKNLIREMRLYQWHPHIPNKVKKEDDDCCDALRYLAFSDGREMKPIEGMKLTQHKYFSDCLKRR